VYSVARRWAATLVGAYVIAVAFVGFTAMRYEQYLYGFIEHMPQLTQWTFHAHRYTSVFILLSTPAILCAISDRLSATERRVAMTISLVGLLLLALWFGLIWLGMGLVVAKFEAVGP
jgi:hypothetical protein